MDKNGSKSFLVYLSVKVVLI